METEVAELNDLEVKDINSNTPAAAASSVAVDDGYLEDPKTYTLSDIWSKVERAKAMLEDLIAAGRTDISRDIFEHFENIANDLEDEIEKSCVFVARDEVVVDEQTSERFTLDNSFSNDSREKIFEREFADRLVLKNYESDTDSETVDDLDNDDDEILVSSSDFKAKGKSKAKLNSAGQTDVKSATKATAENKTFRTAFINIEWTNDKGVDKGGVRSAASSLVQTVNILSRSQFPIKAEVFSKKVKYAHSKKNLNRAEASVINQVGNFDRYVIFNNKLSGPHSGAKIAHLPGSLKTTVDHEFFHAWLGHAGIVEYLGDGKTRVDHTGDGTSFMSRFASNSITSVQFIDMKWLKPTEIAERNVDDPPQTYVLKKLRPNSSQDDFEGQKVVRVRRDGAGKDLFVSYLGKGIKNKGKRNEQRVDQIAVHYGLGGGSQRLGLFPTQKIVEDLIVVTKVEEGVDSQIKLIVGPAPALKM